MGAEASTDNKDLNKEPQRMCYGGRPEREFGNLRTPRQSVNGTRPGPTGSGGDKPATIPEGGSNTTTTVTASPAPKGSAAGSDGKEPEAISAQNHTKRQATASGDSKSTPESPARAGTTSSNTGSPDGAAGGEKPRKSSLRDRLGNKAKARLTIVGPNALRAKTEESLTLQNLFNKELDQDQFRGELSTLIHNTLKSSSSGGNEQSMRVMADSLTDLWAERKQFQSLLVLTSSMNNAMSLDGTIRNIVTNCISVLGVERASLFMVNRKERTVRLAWTQGTGADETEFRKIAEGLTMSMDAGIVGLVAREANTVVVEDCYAHPFFSPKFDQLRAGAKKTRNMISVPIQDQQTGEVIAVLQGLNKVGPSPTEPFTTNDKTLGQFIASIAGQILQNARLYNEAVRRRKEQQALLTILKTTELETDVDVVIETILNVCYDILDVERIALYFVDWVRRDLYMVRSSDTGNFTLSMDKSIAGHVATSGQGLNTPDAYSDKRFDSAFDKATGNVTKSLLTLPIKDLTGKTVAVLQVINKIVHKNESGWVRQTVVAPNGEPMTPNWYLDEPGSAGGTLRVPRGLAGANTSGATSPNPRDLKEPGTPPLSGAEKFAAASNGAGGPSNLSRPASGSVSATGTKQVSRALRMRRERMEKMKKDPNVFVGAPFTEEDEELMIAFCIEVGNILHKYSTTVLLERLDPEAAPENGQRTNAFLQTFGLHSDFTLANDPKGKPKATGTLTKGTAKDLQAAIQKEHERMGQAASDQKDQPAVSMFAPVPATAAGAGAGTSGSALGGTLEARKAEIARDWAATSWPGSNVSDKLEYNSCVAAMQTLEFDALQYSADELMVLSMYILQDLGCVTKFNIELAVLQQFFIAQRSHYRKNPYHNFHHGFCVMQWTYSVVKLCPTARESLEELDILGLMLASLSHDVDHPGNNNMFEIRMNSGFALKYNDVSVLENHHAMTCFEILRHPQANVFKTLATPQFRTIRTRMIKGILATDMDAHFEHCRHLEELVASKNAVAQKKHRQNTRQFTQHQSNALTAALNAGDATAAAAAGKAPEAPLPSNISYFDVKVEKERQFLFNTLVHAADILHATTSTVAVSEAWGAKIATEFGAQVVQEEKHGLPISTFMAGLEKRENFALNQVNFAEKVCMPMLKPIAVMFQPLQKMESNAVSVVSHFRTVLNEHKAKAAAAAAAAAPPAPAKS